MVLISCKEHQCITVLLRGSESIYFFLRIIGLVDLPRKFLNGKVSLLYRLYSYFLSIVSILITIKYFNYAWNPQHSPYPFFRAFTRSQAVLYPAWCLMCSVLRSVVSVSSMLPSHRTLCVDLLHKIKEDPYLLAGHSAPSSTVTKITIASVLMTFSLIFSNLLIFILFYKSLYDALRSPWFYCYLIEISIICSGWVFSIAYLAVISMSVTKNLFDVVTRGFLEDIESRTLLKPDHLQHRIHQHNLVWQLVTVFDTIFNFIIGISITITVPIFCVITTELISNCLMSFRKLSTIIFVTLSFWSTACIASCAVIICVAAATNTAAHSPLQPLLMMNTSELSDLSLLHFLHRLSSTNIGYTYFKAFTVTKITILSVFSLMVTYLIVGLQML